MQLLNIKHIKCVDIKRARVMLKVMVSALALCVMWFNCLRWDLKGLEHHAAHCKHELPLQDRSQHNVGQTASRRSGSGDGGGRKEQEESLGEGESFTSEGSSREGETTDKDGKHSSAVLHLVEHHLFCCSVQ